MEADLDEFRLVRPLGQGGMGDVYLGHDTILDRPVAIKVIGGLHSRDARSHERFLIEARAIARLSHPNVVTIYRVGSTRDGRPFLVQELIHGQSLDRAPLPMPWRKVGEIAVGVARALDAAHRRGILHRDVKPANVMLDDNDIVRLLDFGLAKLADVTVREPPRSQTRLAPSVDVTATGGRSQPPAIPTATSPCIGRTAPGPVLGTPRYTAPENWRGELSTERSDLYSLGALLYELLTGVPPFVETELDALAHAVVAGRVRPVRELAPDADATFANVVMRCLATDPAARFASAAELAHAVETMLVDAPPLPEGNPYRGLRVFDAAHRGLFFGRGRDVSTIVDRLRTEALVGVIGDPGIGSSSVCQAGVVPMICARGLGDGRTWRAVTVSLRGRAWSALCETLGVSPSIDARMLRQAPTEGLLLVFDQLDGLVMHKDLREAKRIIELIAAIADGVPGVKALLAVRRDFVERIAALPALAEPMTRGMHLLRTLTRDELHEAIEGPARAKGVRFETPNLVDDLAAAIVDAPGALPLLQLSLAELWQLRAGDVVPEIAVTALGGVDGMLAGRAADRVLMELDAYERAAARRILVRLVSSTRTRVLRARHELTAGEDPNAVRALESLVRGRLVVARDTLGGMPSYELAYDVLVERWHTLREWLDEVAGEHAVRNRLTAIAAEWQRLDRAPDLLWTPRQLAEVSAEGASPLECAFLDASRRRMRRRRVARAVAIAALPLFVVVSYGAVRLDAAYRRDREIASRVAKAIDQEALGRRFAAAAERVRSRAFDHFESDRVLDGHVTWEVASSLSRAADFVYREATSGLEAVYALEPTSARSPLASTLWAHAELADALHDSDLVRTLVARMAGYEPAARWDVPAHVTLTADAYAPLSIHASSATGTLAGHFDATPLNVGNVLDFDLPPGSYLVLASPVYGKAVRFPILVARGERLTHTIEMPRSTIAGFEFVPAGRYLTGINEAALRRFQRAMPLHFSRTESFWISRFEVTFGEWIAFLRDLPADQRAAMMPHTGGVNRFVRLEERDGTFELEFAPLDVARRAPEGRPLVYPSPKAVPTRSPTV